MLQVGLVAGTRELRPCRWNEAGLWYRSLPSSQSNNLSSSKYKNNTQQKLQSWARDNVVKFSGQIIGDFCIVSTVYSLRLFHLDTEVFTFFGFFLVTEALLRCRVVVVAKLNNCRMLSEHVIFLTFFSHCSALKN